jgi:hypothetical protein
MRHVALLAPLLLVACSGGNDFEADYATAMANKASGPGLAYDHAVENAMQTDAVARAVLECAGAHRELVTVPRRGVMRFDPGGGYTVDMQPDDALSQCLEPVYSNQRLPEPPSRPYLLPIEG